MGRICLFVRVSTLGQQLESQEESLRRAALADGYNEADFIVIGKKESAIKLSEEEREGLNELKSLIETEDLDCIYIAELSRLSRRPQILYSIRELLLHNKIQLKCLHPQFSLLTDDRTKYDATANIIFSLFGALAEQEMLEKKERFARGKRQKAEEGKYNGGAIPYGYKIDRTKDNLIVENVEESKIVKLIFDLYEMGYSQPKLAKEMAETGHADITISRIHKILNNESYCGVKRKAKYASYERAYPPIITKEQFDRCRQIANTNNCLLSKAKAVYYAEHLVKCPSCGAYWSAGGSKASYHCPNAYKAMSMWRYEHHTKEKCQNKTSFSINALDSILWYVAVEKEALYIEQANQETFDRFSKDKEIAETKLEHIKPRLDELDLKVERLASAWIDGSIKRETYDKKKREIADERIKINQEKIQFEEEIERINENIRYLQDIKESNPITEKDIMDVIEGKIDSVLNTYPFQHRILKNKIRGNTDDKERQKIIKRQIKSVEVIPTKIRFPFGIGERDVNVREVIVHSYIPSYPQKEAGRNEGRDYFYVIPNGGYGPRILDLAPSEINIGETPMFYSYKDNNDHYFDDITDMIYLMRFRDKPKRQRRNLKQERLLEQIGDRLSLTEITTKYEVNYSVLYSRVTNGDLPNVMLGGKYYVHQKDIEDMIAKEKGITDKIGNKMTILSVSKMYKASYSNLRVKAMKGELPCELINGKWYMNREDAERLFEKR